MVVGLGRTRPALLERVRSDEQPVAAAVVAGRRPGRPVGISPFVTGRPHRIVLVRHGETEWSRTKRHTGLTDVPLTEAGREEAQMLGARLAGRAFAKVLVSPLGRATETCRLAGLEGPSETSEDLLEWDYGDYEGRTTADIRTEASGWTVWSGAIPGGEGVDDVGARADRVIAALEHVDGEAALVAHGHVLRVLAARWLGLEAATGRLLALDTATLSVLGWEHETRVLRTWNESGGRDESAPTG